MDISTAYKSDGKHTTASVSAAFVHSEFIDSLEFGRLNYTVASAISFGNKS